MKAKSIIIISISFMFLGAFSLRADAACATSDLAGTWRGFAGSTAAGFGGYATGKFVFAADGSFIPGSSFIRLDNGTVFGFSGGQATVNTNCKVTGTFVTIPGIVLSMPNAQMSIDKTTATGVYDRSDGDKGIVNFFKR